MKPIPSVSSVAVVILMFAACSGDAEESAGDPVDTARVEQPAERAPAREPERMTDPVTPDLREEAAAASQGMSWHFKPDWALFGPPVSEGALAFRCAEEGDGVIGSRLADANVDDGATAVLRLHSATGSATAQLTVHESELGQALWEGAPASADTLAALFDGKDGNIIATLDGEPPLSLPADSKVADTIRQCGAQL